MSIPDTPHGLIEASSEATLTLLHGDYNELHVRDRRLVRLVHAELLLGQLTDTAFASMLITLVSTWQTLSSRALTAAWNAIETEDEIDTDWVDAIAHFTRMDQYQQQLIAAIKENPGVPEGAPNGGRYSIQGPGDS